MIAPTLEPLNDFCEQFTQLTGLGHPNAKGGHSGADTWLTGADLAATPGYDYHNQISVDQVAAETIGKETRFRSIELSTRSGSGIPGHSNTLAFNRHGVPLPAQNSPRTLFDRLFSPDQSDSLRNRRHRIDEKLSIIDTVLEHAGNVQRRLSNNDRRKMDEYLESVREIERRVQRDQKWLSIAKPRIDASKFQLDLRPDYTNRRAYYRLMYDLIVLALQTDSTRIVTFQVGREAAGGRVNELGITATHHELSHHGGAADMLSKLAKIDRFHIENFRYLLGRLKATKLLDSTTILYGSGMNRVTHTRDHSN